MINRTGRPSEEALFTKGLRRQIELERKASRGSDNTARRLGAEIDVPLLTFLPHNYLRARVQAEDVGRTYPNGETIEAADVGKFWFVEGYSRVGGPDVLRPDET
jgi:hypothetical protein